MTLKIPTKMKRIPTSPVNHEVAVNLHVKRRNLQGDAFNWYKTANDQFFVASSQSSIGTT